MNTDFGTLDPNGNAKSLFLNGNKSNRLVWLNALFLIALLLVGKASPMAIVFAYVFETVIIGVIHIIKLMWLIRFGNPEEKKESTFLNAVLIGFFVIHYGFFVFIQSTFLYLAFTIFDNSFSTSLNFKSLNVIMNLDGFYWAMISISFSHVIEFIFNFIKNKKYYVYSFSKYYVKPYLRIFIQQFLAIVPFFFLFFGNHVGIVAALMLIVIRALLDFYMNNISKRPARLNKIARYLTKEKPEEYDKAKELLTIFFE